MTVHFEHLTGFGALYDGPVRVADADYHVVLHIDADGDVYEVSGTIIGRTGLDLTVQYQLELEDGSRRALSAPPSPAPAWPTQTARCCTSPSAHMFCTIANCRFAIDLTLFVEPHENPYAILWA
jgi:hypothetical protein